MRARFMYPMLALLAATADAQQLAELRAGDAGPQDLFGQAVDLDGTTLVAGATRHDQGGANTGAAYVFVGKGPAWSEQALLTAMGASAQDQLGGAVSVSGDTVVVTAHGDDQVNGSGANEGSVYVFVRNAGSWSQQARLVAPDAAAGDLFGIAAALDIHTLAVGVPYDDDGGSESGSVHVFVRSGTTWSHQAKLLASAPGAGDRFGAALALDGNTLLVGAPRDDDGGSNAGAVHVFTRTGSTWSEQAKLTALASADDDGFGAGVALDGDTAAIGAPQADAGGLNAGALHVFTRSGAVWTEEVTLTASDAGAFDGFGAVVDLDGGRLVAGAFGDDDSGRSSGAAYVFAGSAASWSEVQKLAPSESASVDFAGCAVAVSGGTVALGAGWDDDDGINSGSVHVFSAEPPPGVGYCSCDGTGTSAPCGNTGAAGRGCANGSFAAGCMLTATGAPSVAAGSFDLLSFQSTPGQPGLYFQGDDALNGGDGIPFGDGLRCAGVHVVRLQVVVANGAGTASSSIDVAGVGGVSAGDVRRYQLWYRDPAGTLCGTSFNLSNGLEVTWEP